MSVRLEILRQNHVDTKHWWPPNKTLAATAPALLRDLANTEKTGLEKTENVTCLRGTDLLLKWGVCLDGSIPRAGEKQTEPGWRAEAAWAQRPSNELPAWLGSGSRYWGHLNLAVLNRVSAPFRPVAWRAKQ